ncbi:hypothetical protein [Bacillus sp. NP247]|nr:hypothetical protein [Bacillus sp. NP247]
MKKIILSLMGIITLLTLTANVVNDTSSNPSEILKVMLSEGDGGG